MPWRNYTIRAVVLVIITVINDGYRSNFELYFHLNGNRVLSNFSRWNLKFIRCTHRVIFLFLDSNLKRMTGNEWLTRRTRILCGLSRKVSSTAKITCALKNTLLLSSGVKRMVFLESGDVSSLHVRFSLVNHNTRTNHWHVCVLPNYFKNHTTSKLLTHTKDTTAKDTTVMEGSPPQFIFNHLIQHFRYGLRCYPIWPSAWWWTFECHEAHT